MQCHQPLDCYFPDVFHVAADLSNWDRHSFFFRIECGVLKIHPILSLYFLHHLSATLLSLHICTIVPSLLTEFVVSRPHVTCFVFRPLWKVLHLLVCARLSVSTFFRAKLTKSIMSLLLVHLSYVRSSPLHQSVKTPIFAIHVSRIVPSPFMIPSGVIRWDPPTCLRLSYFSTNTCAPPRKDAMQSVDYCVPWCCANPAH